MKKLYGNRIWPVLAFAVLSVTVAGAAALLLNTAVKSCACFVVYQTVFIFGAGILITDILFDNSELNPILFLTGSFSLGYAAVIADYFITAMIKLSATTASIVAVATLSLLMLIRVKTGRKVRISGLEKIDLSYILLFFVLLIIIFFAYSSKYVLPDSTHTSAYYHRDALFWIENATALKLSFPPQELRYSGITFYYHYFASIYVAFSSLVTGIDTFSLGYALYPLVRCMILFGGLYFTAQKLLHSEVRRILFLVSLLFSTGIENNTQSRYVAQLIYLPFGFDIAMGYGAYAVGLLYMQTKQKKMIPVLCGTAAVSMLLATGHKAPLALIYMFFACVICIQWLREKNYKLAFTYGGTLVAAFLLVMIFCIGFLLPVEADTGTTGTFGINANLKYCWMYRYRDAYRLAQASGLKAVLMSVGTELLALLVMILSFNPLMMFLDLCAVAGWIKNKKCDPVDVALLVASAIGILLGSFNEQEGMSQMYFSMGAYLPGLLLGFRNLSLTRKFHKSITVYIAALLLFFQVKLYFIERGVYTDVAQYAKACLAGELPKQVENDSTEFEYPIDSIQYEEYEAMLWIRENTPEDSIIMPDKDVCKGQAGYMYYATFAERQAYLEGDCYLYGIKKAEREERRINISHIYLNDMEALEIAREDGVDYIIQTKWIIPTYEGNGCTLVYENNMVKIWKIDD